MFKGDFQKKFNLCYKLKTVVTQLVKNEIKIAKKRKRKRKIND